MLSNVLCGQGIRVSELIKMSQLNDAEIESFLNEKECQIENTTEDKYSTTLIYTHSFPKFYVGISNFNVGCKIFYCDFRDTKFYNSQKLEAVKLGFKYIRKDIDSSGASLSEKHKSIVYVYIKGENKISFFTQIFEDRIQYEIAYAYKCHD